MWVGGDEPESATGGGVPGRLVAVALLSLSQEVKETSLDMGKGSSIGRQATD